MCHCLENYKEQKLRVHWLRHLQSEMSYLFASYLTRIKHDFENGSLLSFLFCNCFSFLLAILAKQNV